MQAVLLPGMTAFFAELDARAAVNSLFGPRAAEAAEKPLKPSTVASGQAAGGPSVRSYAVRYSQAALGRTCLILQCSVLTEASGGPDADSKSCNPGD
eukprot:2713740-Rhodomonas_salina.1